MRIGAYVLLVVAMGAASNGLAAPCIGDLGARLSLALPADVSDVVYDDADGTTGIVLTDAAGRSVPFCVDRRPATMTRGRMYVCALRPEDAAAVLVPTTSPVEAEIVSALRAWLESLFSDARLNELAELESVEGLSEDEARGALVVQALVALVSRSGAKDPFALLAGEVTEGTYTSKGGAFAVPVPYTVEEGLAVSDAYGDRAGFVTFRSDFGAVTGIEFFDAGEALGDTTGIADGDVFVSKVTEFILERARSEEPVGLEVLAGETLSLDGRPCGFLALLVERTAESDEGREGPFGETRAYLFFRTSQRTYVLSKSPATAGIQRFMADSGDRESKDRFVPRLREGLLALVRNGVFN